MMYVGFALDAGRVEMILADDNIEQVREDLQDWADMRFPDYTWITATEDFVNCRTTHEVAESIVRVRLHEDQSEDSSARKALLSLTEELLNLSGEIVDLEGNLIDIDEAANA